MYWWVVSKTSLAKHSSDRLSAPDKDGEVCANRIRYTNFSIFLLVVTQKFVSVTDAFFEGAIFDMWTVVLTVHLIKVAFLSYNDLVADLSGLALNERKWYRTGNKTWNYFEFIFFSR